MESQELEFVGESANWCHYTEPVLTYDRILANRPAF